MLKPLTILLIFFIYSNANNLDNYLKKASDLELYKKDYWHTLLHANKNISEIDSQNFFLSKYGKINPKAELEATLKSFFSIQKDDDNNTLCRFPSRASWLKKELNITTYPNATCKEYNKWLKRIDPQSATIVFPYAHINSPASMFGHTFIRINSSFKSELLTYAINYAANTGDDGGFSFAIKGLFGGYKGIYSILPYTDKLKEYRDTDMRDIWEYNLNLTPQETLKMTKHIWELKDIYSYYFFFDENCSYKMLWLLEVARDGVKLRDRFHLQVNPPETIYAIEDAKLVKSKSYRASKRAIILAYEKKLNAKQRDRALKIANQKLLASDILDIDENLTQKQYTLEAAAHLIEYKHIKGDLDLDRYRKLYIQTLSARSTLGKSKSLKIKTPPNPDEGHRAYKTSFKVGIRDDKLLNTLGFRYAYHDLVDNDIGFLKGTKITFLDTELSYDTQDIYLEKLSIFSLASHPSISSFFTPFSFRLNFGFDKNYIENSKNANFTTSVGFGYTYGGDNWYSYIMLDPLFYIKDNFVAGINTSLGFVASQGSWGKTYMEASYRFYHTSTKQFIFDFSEDIRINKNNTISLEYQFVQQTLKDRQTSQISYNFYF